MNYTKGEWKAEKRGTCYEIKPIDAEIDIIAEVYSCRTGTQDNNAKLIAAAPELYEALNDIYTFCVKHSKQLNDDWDILSLKAIHAIVKAKGKE